MVSFKDINFHGVKARKIGHNISERGGGGYSLRMIDGKVWFASGSFVTGPKGRAAAERVARRMRRAGYRARIVTYADQIAVYCNSRKGAEL